MTETTAATARQSAKGATKKATSTKGSTRKPGAPKGVKRAAKATTPAKAAKAATATKAVKATAPAKAASTPRTESKKATVLALMRRTEGVTLAEIAKVTEWQAHSIRGFISGSLGKKMGLAVESTKNEAGERVYKIVE